MKAAQKEAQIKTGETGVQSLPGNGMPSARHIFLASKSGISLWRGIGSRRPVLGFQ
jgi:hypothetical protein